jgi:hypothetical protein
VGRIKNLREKPWNRKEWKEAIEEAKVHFGL